MTKTAHESDSAPRRRLMAVRLCAAVPVFLLTFLLLTVASTSVAAAQSVDLYPRAELVKAESDAVSRRRQVILGTLKKIRNEVRPEAAIWVEGTLDRQTFHVPDARSSDAVAAHFQQVLADSGEILFQCAGRDCGSSNIWSSTIFERPIIYGPARYQSYFVARLAASPSGNASAQQEYLIVYVAQRATRKVYFHIDRILGAPLAETGTVTPSVLVAALEDRGAYRLDGDPRAGLSTDVAILARALRDRPDLAVAVVCRLPGSGESIDELVRRSHQLADAVVATLIASGVGEQQVSAHGIGPLAPVEGKSAFIEAVRIEEAPIVRDAQRAGSD
jgi:hypothetical protein